MRLGTRGYIGIVCLASAVILLSPWSDSSSQGLHRFLLEQPGVYRIHEVGGLVRFEFDGSDAGQMALLARLVTAGYPVLEFSSQGANLEDAFIKITEGRTATGAEN